jgi:hypothetical protein
MKTRIQSRRRIGKLRAALLAAVLGGLLVSGHAGAQWKVIDPAHIKTQIAEFGKEAARWGEQGRQWYKEYQQFMQQYNSFLSTVQNMRPTFGLPEGTQLEPVAADFMVQQRCGEPSYGGGTAGILGRMISIDLTGNPQQQNWELCDKLQRMRNKQYNEMVAYLQQTMPQMNSELQSAGDSFQGGQKTEGEMNAYAAKLSKVRGDIAKADEEFDARMKAYDTFAKATEIHQGSLTRGTLRGSSGLIQQVTNAAVMRQALCGGGRCDTD